MERDELRTVSAVLFDMDGVLVDSFEMWFAVMNDVARAVDAPPISREAVRDAFGQGVEEDLETFYRGATYDQLIAAYDVAIPRHTDRIQPNPTARAALDALGARGIARAVVTNTQDSAVGPILSRCGLADAVDLVSALRPGLGEKPAPDLLLDAVARLGLGREQVVMVGDADAYDGAAARAAHIPYLHYDLRDGADLGHALRAVF